MLQAPAFATESPDFTFLITVLSWAVPNWNQQDSFPPISRDELRDYADINSKEAAIDPAGGKIPGLPHQSLWTGEEP
jgi:hypothetical protein